MKKVSPLDFHQFNHFTKVLKDVFMRTYASSRVKRNSFYRESELQMFLLISGGHTGEPTSCPPIWRLHTIKIYKGA